MVSQADAAIACLTQKCASPPGAGTSSLPNGVGDCLSTQCANPLLALISGTPAAKRCFGCILVNAQSYRSMDDVASACKTDPGAGYLFSGNASALVLSKHPITESETFVLPSTLYRRQILRTTLSVDGDTPVDVYCSHLSYIQGFTVPYAGVYGAGKSGAQAWEAEQALQAQKLALFVKAKTPPGRLSVVLGNLSSSREVKSGTTTLISAMSPATLALLDASFVEALAPGYVPACTYCPKPENVYGGGTSLWTSHIFLGKPLPILSTQRTLKETVVALPSGAVGAVSDNFGLRSVVARGLLPASRSGLVAKNRPDRLAPVGPTDSAARCSPDDVTSSTPPAIPAAAPSTKATLATRAWR